MKFYWIIIMIIFGICLILTLLFKYYPSIPKYNVNIYNQENYPIIKFNRAEVLNNNSNSISIKYDNTIIVILKAKEFNVEIKKCSN